MVDKQVDILIVGGGLIGATLLLCLQQLGYETVLVESFPLSDRVKPDFDARTLALAPSSVALFQSLQIWADIKQQVTPVQYVHVSEAGCFGATRLQGEPNKPLGYTVEMQHLNQVLLKNIAPESMLAEARVISLEDNTVEIQTDTGKRVYKATLIVAADGADSSVRTLSGLSATTNTYEQSAIIGNIALEKPHRAQAFERFTQEGALALLPVKHNKMALVWSLPAAKATQYLQLSDKAFLDTLQSVFGYRLGRLSAVGKRTCWPLRQIIMQQQIAWPLVFIGNAAHTLHPVAAQGFNLGLRDVATLVECIEEQGLQASMLDSYQQKRRHDQQIIIESTHILAELFSLKMPGLQPMRNAGLLALDTLPFLKRVFSRYARGYGGYIPGLLCSEPEKEES